MYKFYLLFTKKYLCGQHPEYFYLQNGIFQSAKLCKKGFYFQPPPKAR